MKRNVCYQCFGDKDLRAMIRSHGGARSCYFCDRKDAATMPFQGVVDFILERIETFYGRAGDQLPYESREGGYQGWHIDSYDMICDELGLELPRDSGSLFRAIVDGIGDDIWCEYDWLVLEPDESLRFSWERFCDIVKHRRRFFFHDIGQSDGRDPDARSPFQFLDTVCQHAEKAGLIIEMPAGQALYRARARKPRRRITSPAELGPPPDDLATQSNRMNPPGISMFYGADRRKLAVAEIRNSMATVGTFRTNRPSAWVLFDRISNGTTHSQLFVRFCRSSHPDGLRYRSATGEKGTNYVLFAGQKDVVDAAPPEPFVTRSPWLELVRVKHVHL